MKSCRDLKEYNWSMIKKKPRLLLPSGLSFLAYITMAYARATAQRLHYPTIMELFLTRKGAVMNAQSSGSTVVVVLVVLAAVIFWPLIAGDEYLFRVWMFILGMPFFDNASLSFMAVLSLVGLAALIRATSRSPNQPIHPGAILAGLFSVYAIGYMVTAMRH